MVEEAIAESVADILKEEIAKLRLELSAAQGEVERLRDDSRELDELTTLVYSTLPRGSHSPSVSGVLVEILRIHSAAVAVADASVRTSPPEPSRGELGLRVAVADKRLREHMALPKKYVGWTNDWEQLEARKREACADFDAAEEG